MEKTKNNNYLYALTLASFGIGVAELAPIGLLPTIADYYNLSIVQVGGLISFYAVGVIIGIPLVTLTLSHFAIRKRLLLLVLIFSIGNLLCALSLEYNLLLASRLVVAITHGTFFGESYLLASRLATTDKKASNIAVISSGLAFASLIGVPISTFIGLQYNWRISFIFIALVGVLSLLLLFYYLPDIPKKTSKKTNSGMKQIYQALSSKGVLLTLGTTIFGISGVFTVYSYIVPILTDITHISLNNIPKMLFIYGIGNLIGNYLGGKFADKNILKAVFISLIGLISALIILAFSLTIKPLMLIMLLIFGIFAFMPITPLQLYLINLTKNNASFISSLNIGAFNLGNAIGAFVGGQILLINGFGLNTLPYIASFFSLIGLILIFIHLKQEHL